MLLTRCSLITLLVAGPVAAACAPPTTTPPNTRVSSIIDPGASQSDSGIALPDTVRGASIAVPFYTWGSSSCTTAAGEDVTIVGQTVTITPYDQAIPRGAVCTADLHRFERQTTIRAPTGTVTFQLRGRRVGARADEEPITLSRTVIVLPE